MLADATMVSWTYDASTGRLATMTREDGTVLNYDYDSRHAGRVVRVWTSGAPEGVVGTTEQTFSYDGLGRMLASTDNNEPATVGDDAADAWRYDSLGRVVEESQKIGPEGTGSPAAVVSHAYSGQDESRLVYPNGRALGMTTFAPGGALRAIFDLDAAGSPAPGRPIAQYDYLGGRTLVRAMRNGVNLDLRGEVGSGGGGGGGGTGAGTANGALFDAAGQPTGWPHCDTNRSNSPTVVGFDYGYDGAGNPTFRKSDHDGADSQRYAYDSADRLTAFVRGGFEATVDGLCAASTGTWPVLDAFQSWTLDGSGNWSQFTTRNTQATSATVETRTDDTFNAYANIVVRASGLPAHTYPQSHDLRGNLLSDGKRLLKCDAFNRLREVRSTTGTLLAVYTYDAKHRRVRQTIPTSGLGDATLDFAYAGWDVLEERRTTDGATLRQYVEGASPDEHLELDTYLDTEGVPQSGIQERYYYHQDTLRSVHALTDSSGGIVESYVYDPYGRHAVRSGSAGPLVVAGASSVGNRYTYTGRAYDAATGYLYYRYRLYDPKLGRFISRDPIGFAGGVGAYEYVGGSPTWGRDALGLEEDADDDEDPFGGEGALTRRTWDEITRLEELESSSRQSRSTCPLQSFSPLGSNAPEPLQPLSEEGFQDLLRTLRQEAGAALSSPSDSIAADSDLGALLGSDAGLAEGTATVAPDARGEASGTGGAGATPNTGASGCPCEGSSPARAPVQSTPYNTYPRYNPDGTLHQVTTYDAYGRRYRQYDFSPDFHRHDFVGTPQDPAPVHRTGHLPIDE